MFPPVFITAAASPAVTALLGSTPDTRLYPFGEAPQGVTLPYSVWQLITGSPYNHLDTLPRCDRYTTQHDIYGADAASVRAVAEALRDAFEPVAYVVSWRGESRDPVTRNYRLSFDVEWNSLRDTST